MKNKIIVIFGTRPEAIKMCPVIKALTKKNNLDICVCVTGQHKQMLKQVLDVFDIVPAYNLEIMEQSQTLFDININILKKLPDLLKKEAPGLVLVHGDTSTTYAAALCCFYLKIPVGHVEAGLRSNNLFSPFPEEFNRRSVSIVAQLHFAPTEESKNNLLREGIAARNVFVTGNTVIDALRTTIKHDFIHGIIDWASGSRLILVTVHRRENIGEPMRHIFLAFKKIIENFPDTKFVYPIHMNPAIRMLADEIFYGVERIRIIDPLDVIDFHNIMNNSYMILTDSGGIQEEASSLHKPVLVLRDTSERPEGISAGTLKLVGTDTESIFENCARLLCDDMLYKKMTSAHNPFGEGDASIIIADIVSKFFDNQD